LAITKKNLNIIGEFIGGGKIKKNLINIFLSSAYNLKNLKLLCSRLTDQVDIRMQNYLIKNRNDISFELIAGTGDYKEINGVF
jgi:ribosome biogenesis protein Nip4